MSLEQKTESQITQILLVPVHEKGRHELVDLVREVALKHGLDQVDIEKKKSHQDPRADEITQAVFGASFRKSTSDADPYIALIGFNTLPDSTLVEFRHISNETHNPSLQEQVIEQIYERWPATEEIPISPGPYEPPDASEYIKL